MTVTKLGLRAKVAFPTTKAKVPERLPGVSLFVGVTLTKKFVMRTEFGLKAGNGVNLAKRGTVDCVLYCTNRVRNLIFWRISCFS